MVHHTGIHAPIHDITFAYGQMISTTTDIEQQARVQFRGTATKTLLLRVLHPKATNLHLLMAMAEREGSRVLLLTLPRVEVLAVLQHRFFFSRAGG